MATPTAIKASGLVKRYGDLVAVDSISFDVEKGESFGFLGPNGAGKTTTIRMLTGLSKPTAGKAELLGLDVGSNATRAKGFTGVVPEVSNLYDELTALENLLFMGKLYGVASTERHMRAEALLELFRLQEKRDRPFGTLSRGMKRALTIAAALIHNPKILFLDEPTVGLDVMAARSLRKAIKELHDQGMTIFLTTHYLEEADILCDRIAIIVKGRIVATGRPEELKEMAIKEQAVEFTVSGDASTLVEPLAALTGSKPIIVNSSTLRCNGTTNHLLPYICRAVQDAGAEIVSVNTIRPTLEEAFVRITGLSPTVMATEKGGK
jgi:ABC-2 type transport system ATP-binding protein